MDRRVSSARSDSRIDLAVLMRITPSTVPVVFGDDDNRPRDGGGSGATGVLRAVSARPYERRAEARHRSGFLHGNRGRSGFPAGLPRMSYLVGAPPGT